MKINHVGGGNEKTASEKSKKGDQKFKRLNKKRKAIKSKVSAQLETRDKVEY